MLKGIRVMGNSREVNERAFDARLTCAIRKSMLSRIIISTAMVPRFVNGPVGIARDPCLITNAPSQRWSNQVAGQTKLWRDHRQEDQLRCHKPLAKADFRVTK